MILGCTACPARGDCEQCDTVLFRRRMFELCVNFRERGQEQIRARMDTYGEVVAAAEDWLSAAVFDAAVSDCIRLWQGDMLTARQFLEVCRQVHGEQEREAQPALPEPEPVPVLGWSVDPASGEIVRPPGIDREFWNRNVAIGKARQRERNRRIKLWRQEQVQPFGAVPAGVIADCEPSPEAVHAVLAEMAQAGRT